MPCIYVLYSEGADKFYIGSSREDGAENRLKSHNAGKNRSTKGGRPWRVIYEEVAPDYTQARKRENFLKSGVGRRWIRENLTRWRDGRVV